MVDASCVAYLVLLNEAVDDVILHVSVGIKKVRPGCRHKLQGLHCGWIEHVLGNYISRKWTD